MTTKEQFDEIRLMLKTLAVTTVRHDDQIDALIAGDRRLQERIAELTTQVAETNKAVSNLEKQWQAYINTARRQ